MTGPVPGASGEPGMVTAELAVVLPALLLVLAVALSALGLAVDQVSVKAKRAERLGALGRHEGIAAMAVALVEIPE